MSLLSKYNEARKQQVKAEERIPPDEMPIRLPPPPRKGPPLNPPTIGTIMDPNLIMRDQASTGLGGYLNYDQLNNFVNPPSPDNSAGQQNMADLMKQQQDTFGARFVYPDPVDEGGGGDDGGGDDGGGGGGDDGIIIPPEDGDDDIIFPPDGPPIKYPPNFPPQDGIYPPNFPPQDGIYPPLDLPIDLPPGKRPPVQVPPPGIGGLQPFRMPPMLEMPPMMPPQAPPMAPPMMPPQAPPMAPPSFERLPVEMPPMAPPSFERLPVEMPPRFEEARYDDIMRGMEEMEKGIGNLKGVDQNIITNDLLKEINNPNSGGGVGLLPGMNLPMPRMATGMETLVSPAMMRGRRR